MAAARRKKPVIRRSDNASDTMMRLLRLRPHLLDAALGAVGAAFAMALLWVAGQGASGLPFPPVSLADRIIRLTPGDVTTYFIERLQHNAIRLLAAGCIVAFIVLGALLTHLTRTVNGRVRTLTVASIFGAVCAIAALASPIAPRASGVLAIGLLAAAAQAIILTTAQTARAGALQPTDHGRRRVLLTGAGALLGLALTGTALGRALTTRPKPPKLAAVPPSGRAVVPRRAEFPDVPGLAPEITSVADHYVIAVDVVPPDVDPATWSLRVDGVVDHPLDLNLEQLQQRFKVIEEYSVLTCISNETQGDLVGNSKWTGVRLGDVLRAAGVRSSARQVVFHGADQYTVAVPVSRALQDASLIALAQNDEPLVAAHGAPCRVRIPALYGMMNTKWVQRIEVVDHTVRGYWAQRGWSATGIVRTQSRIDGISQTPPRAGQPVWLAGVAWAGERGIRRVEVSTDAGRTWADAQLRPPISPLAWTQWAYRWTPTATGAQQIMCRATDHTGAVQSVRERPPHPSGSSGYPTVGIDVA